MAGGDRTKENPHTVQLISPRGDTSSTNTNQEVLLTSTLAELHSAASGSGSWCHCHVAHRAIVNVIRKTCALSAVKKSYCPQSHHATRRDKNRCWGKKLNQCVLLLNSIYRMFCFIVMKFLDLSTRLAKKNRNHTTLSTQFQEDVSRFYSDIKYICHPNLWLTSISDLTACGWMCK